MTTMVIMSRGPRGCRTGDGSGPKLLMCLSLWAECRLDVKLLCG